MLAQTTVAAGAELRTGARVTRLETTADGVRLGVRNADAVRARACVLACGASYRFVDGDAVPGRRYDYMLEAVTHIGFSDRTHIVSAQFISFD